MSRRTKKLPPPPSSAALEVESRLYEARAKGNGVRAAALREELGDAYHEALRELGDRVYFVGLDLFIR